MLSFSGLAVVRSNVQSPSAQCVTVTQANEFTHSVSEASLKLTGLFLLGTDLVSNHCTRKCKSCSMKYCSHMLEQTPRTKNTAAAVDSN